MNDFEDRCKHTPDPSTVQFADGSDDVFDVRCMVCKRMGSFALNTVEVLWPIAKVYDYESNEYLGPATQDLLEVSEQEPTGAVHALYDNNEWQYVRSDEVQLMQQLGHTVHTVYCMED